MPASTASPPSPVDLDALFRLYDAELTAFAYRRVKNSEAAADLVQDAYLRCLQSGPFGEVRSPSLYLKRIVRNLVIDESRQRRRRGGTLSVDDLSETLADPAPSAERVLSARQEYAGVCRVLDRMPPAMRTALLLSRVDGLTHAEIAERLGVSGSLVSKHIVGALRRCFSELERLQ